MARCLVATLVEPLTAVAVSAVVLHEPIGGPHALGGMLLMFSLWALARRTTRRAADGPAPGLTAPCRD
jgi:drug/metabolite transporter (DMT)-like permease